MTNPKFSVIISAYKDTGWAVIEACRTLERAGGWTYEILVADNSPHGRFFEVLGNAMASDKEPSLLVVREPAPGKTRAQNRAIGLARGEITVFLDDDVIPNRDLLAAYDDVFAHHQVAAVQGRITLHFEDEAHVPGWLTQRLRLDLAEMDFPEFKKPFEMALTGANMAIRRDVFARLGGFDENLGPGRSGSLEDEEFFHRLRAAGYTVAYTPHARARHLISRDRLTLRRFARLYRELGASEARLSASLVKGGPVRFGFYTARQIMRCVVRSLGAALRGRVGQAIEEGLNVFFHIGWWRTYAHQVR